jgi:hypothetical protein
VPPHWLRPVLAIIVFAAGALILTSCSSGAPPVAGGCGYLYTLVAPSGTSEIGGCAGSLSTTPVDLVIRQGQTFQIVSVTDLGGTASMKVPTSDAPSVVALVHASHTTGRYLGIDVGEATVSTTSILCNGGPIDSTATSAANIPAPRICPVVQVQVTS